MIDMAALDGIGVYQIRNLVTGQMYVGSTKKSFKHRLACHLRKLRNNKHVSLYLQNSWNKYGEENFVFEIVEECERQIVLVREGYWIKQREACDPVHGFNCNPHPSESPSNLDEVKKKISDTLKRRHLAAEIPRYNTGSIKAGNVPWNKGINFTNLKSKATKRQSLPRIQAFDLQGKLLGTWSNIPELTDWSITEANDLPIKSRYGKEWAGQPVKFLQRSRLAKACKSGSPYKGLIFKYDPSDSNV